MAQGFDAVPASDDDDGSARREARLLEQIEAELRSNDPLGETRARRLMGDLLAPYVQNIFRWCVVRGLSPPDADETTGDALKRLAALLWRKRTFDQPFAEVAWMNVHYAYLDFRRKRFKNRAEYLAGDEVPDTDSPGDETADPVVDRQRFLDLVHTYLSDREKQIVLASVVEGYPSEQIGRALGMTEGAVNTAKSRAIGKLRRGLDRGA